LLGQLHSTKLLGWARNVESMIDGTEAGYEPHKIELLNYTVGILNAPTPNTRLDDILGGVKACR
jgi:hypothetical protein